MPFQLELSRVGTLQGVVPQLSCEVWGKSYLIGFIQTAYFPVLS